MPTTIELWYDEERDNHIDDEGRTVEDLFEEYPDMEHVEPPNYSHASKLEDGTYLLTKETIVVELNDDDAPEVEPDAEGDGYNYSYNEEEDTYECEDCDFVTESTENEGAIKGHWTIAHGGDD